jgi:uncharacterized protein
VRAAPDQQQRLLELQAIDTKLQQLEHQRATHPGIRAVETLDGRLTDLHRKVAESQTAAADLKREVSRAEAEVNTARDRLEKNRQRVESGALSAKDAQAVAADMTALEQWIATLEETQLDAMERQEAHLNTVAMLEKSHRELADERTKVAFDRDKALADIDMQVKRLVAARAELAASIFAELLNLYDKIRARLGGIGAAKLAGGVCEGCGLSLPPGDLEAATKAAPDQVVRCEECGRILVRQDQTPTTPVGTAG